MANGCLFIVAVGFVVLTSFLTTSVSEFLDYRIVLHAESLQQKNERNLFDGLSSLTSFECEVGVSGGK